MRKKSNQYRDGAMQPIKTDEEALTLALVLGITAESEEDFLRVQELIEGLVVRMSEVAVARCKRDALKQLQAAAQ